MYTATQSQLHHLSVGAVVRTPDGRYLVHRRADGSLAMMTETVESGEAPADAVLRGMREEMGVTATVTAYLGCTVSTVTDQRGTWTKATLWHAANTLTWSLPQSSGDGDLYVACRSEVETGPHDSARWPDAAMLDNVKFSGVPAGHSSNPPAGGTSAGTQG